MQKFLLKNYFVLSIILHTLLLSFFFSWFHFRSNPGKNSTPTLNAYAYNVPTPNFPTAIAHEKTIALKSHAQQNSTLSTQNQERDKKLLQADTRSDAGTISKDTKNILLNILHNAIAEKQFYPENALALQQSGTVKIGFWLQPNGQLTQIALLKSSGFESIDSAALSAVKALPTIQQAQNYLKNAEFFAIDVVFQ